MWRPNKATWLHHDDHALRVGLPISRVVRRGAWPPLLQALESSRVREGSRVLVHAGVPCNGTPSTKPLFSDVNLKAFHSFSCFPGLPVRASKQSRNVHSHAVQALAGSARLQFSWQRQGARM